MSQQRILVIFLRLFGGVTVLAFLAMLLPVEWMAATHQWLGLGEFPRAPIVDYLARSVSALYGFHGVLVLLVARDPVRYRSIVLYLGWMYIVSGAFAMVIDISAPLPWWWTAIEGPSTLISGVLILYLSRSLRA
ncbi:MAG TPA: hypothetical protein VH436_17430 [Vicinamibacterales bacterium]